MLSAHALFPSQYDNANKEVAILCNHQKGVNKNHDASMAKHAEKKAALEEELAGLKGGAADRLRCVPRAGCAPPRSVWSCKATMRTLFATRSRAVHSEKIEKLEATMESKESLKTVSLGTSKINYLDPRWVVSSLPLPALPLPLLAGSRWRGARRTRCLSRRLAPAAVSCARSQAS